MRRPEEKATHHVHASSANSEPSNVSVGGKAATPGTGGGIVKYHPSVFRYVCRGRLTLDSLRRPNEAGVCRGFQTELQHVDHWRLSTEEEAVYTFQAKAALNDVDHHPPSGPLPPGASGASQNSQGDASAHAVQPIYMGNVLVYPPQPPEKTKTANAKKEEEKAATHSLKGSNNKNRLSKHEEEAPPPEEWACYGTTEVDLLVLRPEDSKEERIVAVAPFCAPGMTIRDVSVEDVEDDFIGKDRTSTIRLGFLEILYQSSIEANPSELQKHDSGKANSGARGKSSSGSEAEDTSRPTFLTRFSSSSSNILKQMQINAKLLAETTQDDFFNRTKSASSKILQEMPRTFDRTTNLMWKVITWDWSFPPDEGGDAGPPKF